MNISAFIHHGPVAVAFLITAAVALAVLAVVAARSRQMALGEREEFVVQVNKLIAADNVERAAKLCVAGNGWPVALLVGVGLDVILRSTLRPADGVERAKVAMADRLPVMVRALMPGVVAAAVVACLSTALGALVIAQAGRVQPWDIVLGLLAPVDALAAWSIVTRLRVRGDLARTVADFGSFGR
jgi:hypothetical protein